MEKLVERENKEMKLLSGDCTRLKKELSETKSQYGREYQSRMQVESLVERLRQNTGKEIMTGVTIIFRLGSQCVLKHVQN